MDQIERIKAMGFYHYTGRLWARVAKLDGSLEPEIIIAAKFAIDRDYSFYKADERGDYRIGSPIACDISSFQDWDRTARKRAVGPADWPIGMIDNWPAFQAI